VSFLSGCLSRKCTRIFLPSECVDAGGMHGGLTVGRLARESLCVDAGGMHGGLTVGRLAR
jgi:hypothetical protein